MGLFTVRPKRKNHILSKILNSKDRYIFPAPAIIFFILLMVIPLIYVFWLSLHKWYLVSRASPHFVGLSNYIHIILEDLRFKKACFRVIYYTFLAIVIQLPLGMVGALIFNKEFWGHGLLRTFYILPLTATPVAISLIWVLMMHPSLGLLNYLLSVIHIGPFLWISSRKTVMIALILVDTWMWTPLMMLILLGGLSGLPVTPYESAKIDGASYWQMFWRITIPLLRPVIVAAVIIRTIDALKTFDLIYVMTEGGPGEASETLNIYLFSSAFQYYRMGYASSIAIIFLAIILCVCLILIRIRRSK